MFNALYGELPNYITDRGVTMHFFHKRYLICITIRFIGNCKTYMYSLKSMLVDMGAAMFFFYVRSLTY